MVPKPFTKGAFRWVTSDQLCAPFRSSESKFSSLASRFCWKSDSLSSISFVLVSLISSSLSSMTFATIVSCALASICFSSFNNRSIPFVSQDLHSHTSPEVFDMAIKMLDGNPEQLPAWYHELHRIHASEPSLHSPAHAPQGYLVEVNLVLWLWLMMFGILWWRSELLGDSSRANRDQEPEALSKLAPTEIRPEALSKLAPTEILLSRHWGDQRARIRGLPAFLLWKRCRCRWFGRLFLLFFTCWATVDATKKSLWSKSCLAVSQRAGTNQSKHHKQTSPVYG